MARSLRGRFSRQIKGKNVKFVFVPREQLNGDDGEADSDSMTIRLASDLQGDELRRTLCHEIFHFSVYNTGLHHLIDRGLEEALADLVESVDDLMQDNLIRNLCK